MSVPYARVGDLAEQIRGVTYEKQEASPTWQPGYLPLLRANNITEEGLTFDNVIFIPVERISTKQRVRRHDVIVAASSGSLDVVGKAAPALINFEGGFGAFCKVLRPNSRVHPGYFAHFFKTLHYRQRISVLAAGANINNLRNEHLNDFEIPLPPLPDQQRIAAILDQAESMRAKRREALVRLDGLTQAIFLEMFGDPETNPMRWPIQPLSTYVADFQGGKSVDAEVGENIVTRNRVLKVSAVTSMVYRPDESKPVPDNYAPPPEHFPKIGDLLFSRANTTELVGAVAYVQDTPDNVLLSDKLWRFIWKKPVLAESLFVWALFQTPAVRREIGRRATGTSGSMKNISQSKVLGIPTILPHLSLQREFAARVEAVERLKAVQRASLARLDALFASLQHRAFRGEL
ncbi:MAG: restriction endonuclease subunit S [Chloroflexi bacterium]|nr:restriction endonuclease subunit S [Chloroflexota bacterium]